MSEKRADGRIAEAKSATRILLVDDQPIVRHGVKALLEQTLEFEVAAEARNASETLDAIRDERPNLIVLEIAIGDMAGLDLIRDVLAQDANARICVLSQREEPLLIERSLQAGALGYLTKRSDVAQILEGLATTAAGRVHVSQSLCQELIDHTVRGGEHEAGDDESSTRSVLRHLSDRELEVFLMIGKGLNASEIADKLHRSVKTIHTHRANLKDKLHLSTNTELVHFATQWAMAAH